VLVASDGTFASYVAAGADSVRQLLDRALAEHGDSEEQALRVGSSVPELILPVLDGEPVNLARVGEETLILFWNPGCGFCSSMRDDLLAWEQHTPVGAPRLLVVSSGDEPSVRAEGFSSTVALDPDFSAGAAFGAGGTPMAILVDSEGRIASPLTAGAEAVFALAGGRGRVGSGRVGSGRGVPVARRAKP
jgi:thiol-disulfide isomerase/thioredoxin